ncbi:MAG: nickel insertion protein, partial [Thermodesulfobacteriota bacterium]
PNVLRLFIGSRPVLSRTESVVVLETNIDDMEPRIFEHAMNLLLEAGALDVYLTPLIMKKSRPAVRMSVISTPESVSDLQSILLKETTTFGVRAYETSRRILERRWVRVETPYGRVRTKLGLLEGRVVQRMPEYEDCRRAALRHKVPLKRVLRAAEKASRGVV